MTMMKALTAILLGIAAPAVAATPCALGQIAELPVTMMGLRPTVRAGIEGQDAPFLVDSGAFWSMLPSASVARFGLHAARPTNEILVRGVNGSVSAEVAMVRTLKLAGLAVPRIEFLVGGSTAGSQIVGIFGQNLLHIADVEYDLANGVIRLMRPTHCDHASLAYWTTKDTLVSVVEMQPTTAREPHAVVAVTVNGVKLRALLDTGAATSMLTRSGARRAGVLPDSAGTVPGGISSGIGRGGVKTWIGRFDSFELGGLKVMRTRLRFGDIELANADMLLGDDFFLSNRVFVANSQNLVYFTYNGGHMFDLSVRPAVADAAAVAATPAADAPTPDAPQPDAAKAGPEPPADADALARRGAALLVRGDVDAAIAELGRAVALAPTVPRYFVQRAQAFERKGQPFLAMRDLDAALALQPDLGDALVMRATLRLRGRDGPGSVADLDAAAQHLDRQSGLRLDIARLYASADRFAQAAREFDLWLSFHADNADYWRGLNGACWARARGNFELDRALAQCDRAVSRGAHAPVTLDSRGLVYLRLGQYDRAVADYTEALAQSPKLAWSLYGRGVARVRKGDAAGGQDDIAAAAKLAPRLADEAKRLAVVP